MPVDMNTHTGNIRNDISDPYIDNPEIQKISNPKPVNHNRGIAGISNAGNDLTTAFYGTPKPSLQKPEMPLEQWIDETVEITLEITRTLGIESKTVTMAEFIKLCSDKIKSTLDENLHVKNGDKASEFDSETMECLILLLTMESKSALIRTLRDTLQAKIKDRTARNQDYINKTAENDQKSAEQIKKAKEAEARQKLMGILGSVLSVIVAVISAVLTVATFGAASVIGVLAIGACIATCAGSGLTIAGIANDNKGLQKAGMWCGIAGALLSLGTCAGTVFFKATVEAASRVMRIISAVGTFAASGTQSTFQIIEGFNRKSLAETQKELDQIGIDMKKLDMDIKLLSEMIDKVGEFIQQLIKDLLQNEEQVAQMVQQMMNAAFGIEQNVKC